MLAQRAEVRRSAQQDPRRIVRMRAMLAMEKPVEHPATAQYFALAYTIARDFIVYSHVSPACVFSLDLQLRSSPASAIRQDSDR